MHSVTLAQKLVRHPARTRESASVSWERALGIERYVDAKYSERRLAPGAQQVDELLAVSQRAALPVHDRLRARSRQRGEPAEWKTVARLLEHWGTGRSAGLNRVSTVWFEFDDVGRGLRRGQLPSISACLVPDYDPNSTLTPDDRDATLGSAREVLRALGASRRESKDRALRECFAELPRSGQFIHVSYMMGRQPRAVKLYGTMQRSDLLPYLMAIRFRGDLRAIRAALDELYPRGCVGDEIFFDLNLANFRTQANASLGLAVGQQHVARGPDRDPSRARLLDTWIGAGLCRRAESLAVRAWLRTAQPDDWRAFLDIKLVWSARDGTIAKAYLGARRCPRTW